MARIPAWDDDVDMNAFKTGFRPSRSKHWKVVLAGLGLVAAATFVGAYYVPLHRAHAALSAEHQTLRGKHQSAEQALKDTRAELSAATAKRDELESQRKERDDATRAEVERQRALATELSTKLAKYVSKGNAKVTTASGAVFVSFADSLLFAGPKADITPRGKVALCDLAKASGENALEIVVPGAEDALADSTERAASAAEALSKACRVPARRLSATGQTSAGSALAKEPVSKELSERIDVRISAR